MNTVNYNGFKQLNQNEFDAVHEILKGKKIDFTTRNWSYNLMQDILQGVSKNSSTTIDESTLFKKLFMSSDKELLEIIIDSGTILGLISGYSNKLLEKKFPKEKLIEVSEVLRPKSELFEWDSDKMSELEFLMVSQTMKNDFIVFEVDSKEGNILPKWSANKDNFRELVDELLISNQRIEIQKLEIVKENIFN